jgi:hypothetical protein
VHEPQDAVLLTEREPASRLERGAVLRAHAGLPSR